MENLWLDYGSFLLKLMTIVVAIILVLVFVFESKEEEDGHIDIKNLTDKYLEQQERLEEETLDAKSFKALQKTRKLKKKENSDLEKSRLFVLSFNGDVTATAADALREEISAILAIAKPGDEVLLQLESPGGSINGYGFAAAQLTRLRKKNIHLTVAIDQVGASGGYMMASVANKIVAAPFAVVGSIGVVAEFPNFYRLMKKHHVDYEVMTSGEHKRTISVMGKNSEEGKQKFQSELEEAHRLFKLFVAEYRPQIDVSTVATGEAWYGTQALQNKLIDAIATSDDLIIEAISDKNVYQVQYKEKESFTAQFFAKTEKAVVSAITKIFGHFSKLN